MSVVKVKSSVLQSIIKKHLNESNGKRGDVSRRLTVGPDSMTIPDELPLSPSDRMSVQLETERPPVEDPEYVPANSKELGLAIKALAEMVKEEQVEEAYNSFKRVIEMLEEDEESEGSEEEEEEEEQEEEEESEDEEEGLQESLQKKYKALMKLLKEADASSSSYRRIGAAKARAAALNKRYQGTATDIYDDGEEDDLGDEDSDEPALSSAGSKLSSEYPDAVKNWELSVYDQRRLEGLVSDYELDPNQLDNFMMVLDTSPRPSTEEKSKIWGAFEKKDKGLAGFIKDYVGKNTTTLKAATSRGQKGGKKAAAPAAPVRAVDRGVVEWDQLAKEFGYKAASGLRQGTIRDIIALRAPIGNMRIEAESFQAIRLAFKKAVTSPSNESYLSKLLGDEYLEAIRSHIADDDDEVYDTSLFRYFQGLIFISAFKELGDYELRSGKKIGEAWTDQAFAEGNPPTAADNIEVNNLIKDGYFTELVYDAIEEHEDNNFMSLISSSALHSEEDVEAEEAGGYESPSIATVKKISSIPNVMKGLTDIGREDLAGEFETGAKAAAKAAKRKARSL
jgi:hypothetical protein